MKNGNRRRRRLIFRRLRFGNVAFRLEVDFSFFRIFFLAQRVFEATSQQVQQRRQHGLAELDHLEIKKQKTRLTSQRKHSYRNLEFGPKRIPKGG